MPELAMASPRPHEGPTVFVEQAKHLPHLHVSRLPPPPTNVLRETPNGPELTGADPHAQKFSTREEPSCGSASGAAWSWAAVTRAEDH